MEYVTAFFAFLIVLQTVIFLLLFRRAVMQLDITRLEELASRLREIESRLNGGSVESPEPSLNDSALTALKLIGERGSVTASDVKVELKLSREHVARVLKNLYEMGLVNREGKPFRYSLTDSARRLLHRVDQPATIS